MGENENESQSESENESQSESEREMHGWRDGWVESCTYVGMHVCMEGGREGWVESCTSSSSSSPSCSCPRSRAISNAAPVVLAAALPQTHHPLGDC